MNIQSLSRDQKHEIPESKSLNPNPASYPHTHIRASDCFCQFQPTRVKKYLCIEQVNDIFWRAYVVFAMKKIGGQVPGQIVTRSSITG